MQQETSLFSISLDGEAKVNLQQAGRWARFLAITGIILLVLVTISVLIGVSILGMIVPFNSEADRGTVDSVQIVFLSFYFIFAILTFIPLLFLLQFGNRARRVATTNQQADFNAALLNLKRYFRFLGIVLLIILIIYGLSFLFQLLAFSMFTK